MTPEEVERERGAFEAYYLDRRRNISRWPSGEYLQEETAARWEAWAGRAERAQAAERVAKAAVIFFSHDRVGVYPGEAQKAWEWLVDALAAWRKL